MTPVRLLVLLGLVACTDYNLSKNTDGHGRDGEDSDGGPSTDSSGDTGYEEDVDPRVCEARSIEAQTITQNEECFEEGPTVGSFTPVVEWTKDSFRSNASSNNVMMMPAVGSLTDDDGDGDADADDVPDVVFTTYGSDGTIRVVSGDGGTEHFSIANQQLQGQGGLALGDIDGDGWTDIVAPTSNTIKVFDHTGSLTWTSQSLSGLMYGTSDNPAISDMDGDGSPEIIVGAAIIDNTGRLVGRGAHGIGGVNGYNVGTASFAVDIDGDGEQEVVTGNALYARDGSTIWYNREDDGYPAVGNFDGDAAGEIVVAGNEKVRLQDDDGTVLCRATVPGATGGSYYGGPPTIADFDGDGEAEFASAAGSSYTVFESDCSVKWTSTTQDATSGNTGSSVFDFEGDGTAEAVYGDEIRLWVFAGPDGSVKLSSRDHSNNTWLEYPAIADIDGDGQAEIVVANTPSSGGNYYGITVIGDADESWMPGRKLWNQHAYHITNVNDDGTIPAVADRNWESYNNFRSGDITAGGGYSGPDLRAKVYDVCLDECDRNKILAWVTVENAGYQDVEDDVVLVVYGIRADGTEVEVYNSDVTVSIPAGQRLAAIEFEISPIPGNLVDLRAEIDGGSGATNDVVSECDETNNEDEWDENLCP